MATWLITGATGFLGRHLLDVLDFELLRAGRTGDAVLILGRRCPTGWPEQSFVRADLDDPAGLREAIGRVVPDHVIHTAGQTPPAPDDALYQSNFWATIRLLNALRSLNRRVRVTLAGSAAELGPVPPAALPVAESYPCSPLDAYGRSKLLATIAGLAERPPLELAVARVFNPIGPGMPPTQAFGEFAAQLTAGVADPLPLLVGDLEVRRDFVDVRDVARALVAVSLRGQPRLVYHVGSGQSRSVGEGLDLLVRLSGRSVKVCVDPRRHVRKSPDDSRADIRRIISHTGWRPTIPFEQSLADLWNDLRKGWDRSGPEVATRLPLTA
ncbi:MAG: NAD-dependent epimerase/dehydratase family protein [Isosphaeraceae bacterium]